jgi:hypothetical protein
MYNRLTNTPFVDLCGDFDFRPIPVNDSSFICGSRRSVFYFSLPNIMIYLPRFIDSNVKSIFKIDHSIFVQLQNEKVYEVIIGENLVNLKETPIVTKDNFKNITFYYGQGSTLIASINNRLYTTSFKNNRIELNILTDIKNESSGIENILYLQKQNIIIISTEANGIYIYKPKQLFQQSKIKANRPISNYCYTQIKLNDSCLMCQDGITYGTKKINPPTKYLEKVESIFVYKTTKGNIWYHSYSRFYEWNPKTKKSTLKFIDTLITYKRGVKIF